MTPVRRTLLVLLTIAVLVVAAGALYVRHWLAQPLALGAEPVVVDVQPGQTLTAVARELAARGLLTHPRLLALYGRFIGADSRMHAGEFSIKPGTSPRGLLQALVSGAVVQHSVTIVEGWTFRELRKALAAVPTLSTRRRHAGRRGHACAGEDGKPRRPFFPDTHLFGKAPATRPAALVASACAELATARRRGTQPAAQGRLRGTDPRLDHRAKQDPDERARGVFVEDAPACACRRTRPSFTAWRGSTATCDALISSAAVRTIRTHGGPADADCTPGRPLRRQCNPTSRRIFSSRRARATAGTRSRRRCGARAAVRQYLVRYRQQNSKGR
jgi:hypothetical protein